MTLFPCTTPLWTKQTLKWRPALSSTGIQPALSAVKRVTAEPPKTELPDCCRTIWTWTELVLHNLGLVEQSEIALLSMRSLYRVYVVAVHLRKSASQPRSGYFGYGEQNRRVVKYAPVSIRPASGQHQVLGNQVNACYCVSLLQTLLHFVRVDIPATFMKWNRDSLKQTQNYPHLWNDIGAVMKEWARGGGIQDQPKYGSH